MLGPPDPEQCQVLGEGCVCSEGTILHRRHSGLCIPEEKCGKSLPSPGTLIGNLSHRTLASTQQSEITTLEEETKAQEGPRISYYEKAKMHRSWP